MLTISWVVLPGKYCWNSRTSLLLTSNFFLAHNDLSCLSSLTENTFDLHSLASLWISKHSLLAHLHSFIMETNRFFISGLLKLILERSLVSAPILSAYVLRILKAFWSWDLPHLLYPTDRFFRKVWPATFSVFFDTRVLFLTHEELSVTVTIFLS